MRSKLTNGALAASPAAPIASFKCINLTFFLTPSLTFGEKTVYRL
jgi:hypothetical protein